MAATIGIVLVTSINARIKLFGHNQIRVPPDHFANYLRIALHVSLSGVPPDDKVLALDIAKPVQLFEECSDSPKSLE